jgi:serine/threonine protein kinase
MTGPASDASGASADPEYDLFVECTALDPAARADRLRGVDPALASRVLALLAIHDREERSDSAGRLDGARRLAAEAVASASPGTRLGRYRLEEKLGDGGMGEVYLATQLEPVRRVVAVKLLRPGAGGAEVVSRFAAERTALGVMSHPGIAGILDAGESADGRPYLVMEYVAGPTITAYSALRRSDLRERVRLMREVCRAVQHAHFKGVIHRDLKPTNVLVTEVDGEAQPKVIDFGVAKLLQAGGVDTDHHTRIGQIIGTPAYMSPEQALGSALDVDLRADVWSLGAILYELLTGSPPHPAVEGEPLHSLVARVQAGEIERPSRRAAAAGDEHAKSCGYPTARALARALEDELDWILLHALERDRTRRFPSAESMAADLDRFLRRAPVESRPPGAIYSLRKTVARHRVAAAVAATLVLGSGVYVATLVRYTHELQAERDRASREAAIARRVTQFVGDVFETANPRTADEVPVTARDLLQVATRRMQQERVTESAETQAELLGAAGRAHVALGMLPEGVGLLRESLDLLSKNPAPDVAALSRAHLELARAERVAGAFAVAERHAREALRLRRENFGEEAAETLEALSEVGYVVSSSGRRDDGLAELTRARASFERQGLTAHPEYGGVLMRQGLVLLASGRMKEAELALKAALEQLRRSHGELSLDAASAGGSLAAVYADTGRLADAIALDRESVARTRALYGPRHPEVASALNNLGTHLSQDPASIDEALATLRAAVDISLEVRGRNHPYTGTTINNLGLAATRGGRHAEAETYLREALAIRLQTLGPDHPDTAATKVNLALTLMGLGRSREAVTVAREAVLGMERSVGMDHWRTANARRMLGEALTQARDFPAAERELRTARDALVKALGADNPRTLRAEDALAALETARRAGRP